MKSLPAWCPGGRQRAKAVLAPWRMWSWAVSATWAELYTACQVPAVIGASVSKQ
ncbi:hypothetical protein D3C81_2160290 [compost metagenome]